jgi:LuxR family transcriptional regulator, maltose regulon positive regulatory protein
VAWLSLGRGDNDPVSFWTYVIAALRTAASGVGEGALALLQAPQPPPIETVLTALLNDLAAMPGDVVLVLDDYHVIEARAVQDGMAFLLDHSPPGLHVVIASRADPALPLARLRARGELVETRAAELRFTPDEAAAYLTEMMGLRLTARDVAALEGRTEGWIAALQLAALSMQGRDDVAGFIAGFAGDDRYVVDYLAEEVLQRQPDRVQAFLLQTSVLSRLSGALCDAVTGHGDGKAMLAALDRGNLFLVPLDDRRQWYRYHQLFADVLQARLLDEQPGQVPDLHRRASAWYERSGEPSEAIRHALAAEDFGRGTRRDLQVDVPALTEPHAGHQRTAARLPDVQVPARAPHHSRGRTHRSPFPALHRHRHAVRRLQAGFRRDRRNPGGGLGTVAGHLAGREGLPALPDHRGNGRGQRGALLPGRRRLTVGNTAGPAQGPAVSARAARSAVPMAVLRRCGAHRTRRTGRIAAAPMIAQSPATMYSTP